MQKKLTANVGGTLKYFSDLRIKIYQQVLLDKEPLISLVNLHLNPVIERFSHNWISNINDPLSTQFLHFLLDRKIFKGFREFIKEDEYIFQSQPFIKRNVQVLYFLARNTKRGWIKNKNTYNFR